MRRTIIKRIAMAAILVLVAYVAMFVGNSIFKSIDFNDRVYYDESSVISENASL